jgi:hypothetical protein
MSWNDEIENIKLGTLFKFFGKSMIASILWILVFYLILLGPIFLFVLFMAKFQ